MDSALFQSDAAGELVSIYGGKEYAFVPAPLPRDWVPPRSLTRIWVEARDVLGELRGTARTLPDHTLLTRPLKQREALRSSSLEGTYATPEELLTYEMNPRDPYSANDPANSWREVSNYHRALEAGQELVEDGYPFSEWLIRRLHQQLLVGVRGEDKSPGEIRTQQIHIGTDHRFTPPPQEHLSQLLGQLERDMQAETDIDPLMRALMVHYQFEAIHPFRDGNGRVGRLLLALMISRWCDFDMPWLYLSEFFEKHRDEYIDALFGVSARSDWARWIGFGLAATIETGRNTIQRIRSLLALKEVYEDRIRKHEGRDRLVYMVPALLSSPIIKYADLMNTLRITYPTARADMDALVDMKIVRELTTAKSPKLFVAHEIFNLAYFDGN